MNKFFSEILKFVLIYCLVNLFYWTGQLIFLLVTLGYYSPSETYAFGQKAAIRYREQLLGLLSVIAGFAFWLVTFPVLYDLFNRV